MQTPPDPQVRPATRFLSRHDKSATNIKECQIFISIGQVFIYFFSDHLPYYPSYGDLRDFSQVPWALNYSKWYHQYPRFPAEALQAAALLSEYTLTDGGTLACLPKSMFSHLKTFKTGSDDANDPLLNPVHILRGKGTSESIANQMVHKKFMSWVVSPNGGQSVIENFSHFMLSKARDSSLQ